MAITEGFRHFSRIGLDETRIRLRQVHAKEMNALTLAGDDRIRLTKIHLRMASLVAQRHKHLLRAQALQPDIIAEHRQPARIAMLIPKPLENPLARMPLLAWCRLILSQDPVDHRRQRACQAT